MSRCFNGSDCLFFETCQNSAKLFCPGTCEVSRWFIQIIVWTAVATLCVIIGKQESFILSLFSSNTWHRGHP